MRTARQGSADEPQLPRLWQVAENSDNLPFRGVGGDEESRNSFIYRARFVAPLGMTTFRIVFH